MVTPPVTCMQSVTINGKLDRHKAADMLKQCVNEVEYEVYHELDNGSESYFAVGNGILPDANCCLGFSFSMTYDGSFTVVDFGGSGYAPMIMPKHGKKRARVHLFDDMEGNLLSSISEFCRKNMLTVAENEGQERPEKGSE